MTLTKPPSQLAGHNQKLLSIEAARGVAAVMVVFYHAARHVKADFGFLPWRGIAQFGHAGVDFFFVLSGFIIFAVHRKDFGAPSRLGNYFQRRFTRIYPYYWVSICIGIMLVLLSSKPKILDVGFLMLSATLLPISGDVGIAWTLQHEMLFYFIFSIAIFNLRIGACVFVIWFLFIVWTWIFQTNAFGIAMLDRLAAPVDIEFFFGMLAAFLVKGNALKNFKALALIGVFFFLAFGVGENMHLFDGYQPSARLAYGLTSMLIVIGIAGADMRGSLPLPRILVRVGNASYSIYLFHLVCIGVTYKLLAVAGLLTVIPVPLLYLILVLAGIGGGIVLSRFVEIPLIQGVRTLNSIFSRNKPART